MRKSQRLTAFILVFPAVAFFLFYRLGNDSVTTDDTHSKNWSYVFMKEFEAGNYDALYVTVQPGVVTIYSNIVGFKGFHFLKDKLGYFGNLTEKQADLMLHTFSKIPKSILLVILLAVSAYLAEKIFNKNVGLVLFLLLGLEPFVLGNSRAISTDILPAYLVFISALVLMYKKSGMLTYSLVGVILGISNIEKASSVIALPFFILFILYYEKGMRKKIKCSATLILTFFITMVVFFPAFWGNFFLTTWRIFIGSFIQGIKGLDVETFTYELSPHSNPWYFYFRFFYNQLSEVVILGLGIGAYLLSKNRPNLKKYLPIILVPITFFVVHQIATKKGARFMLYTFPFLILYASLAFSKVFTKSRFLYVFLVLVILLRFIQYRNILPDFLIYTNALTIDSAYNATYKPWGIGYWKLAQHIKEKYGANRKLHLGDFENIKLFYEGEVKNFDEKTCEDKFDLVIQTGKFPQESCYNDILALNSIYIPYKKVIFYIYVTKTF